MSNIKGIKIEEETFDFEDTEGRTLAQTKANEAVAGLLEKIQSYFEVVNDGFVVTVEAENCTVKYYRDNTFAKELLESDGAKCNQARTKAGELAIPCNVAALEPQINFTVVPNEGYTIDDLEIKVKDGGEEVAVGDVCNQIKTPTGTIQVLGVYKDQKSNGTNRYTATKVKKPFTIVFSAKAPVTE